MDGILNILKPSGYTSHDIVSIVRKKLNIKKVGHTGTLDPNVAGVLPITVGKATKLTSLLQNKQKEYRCMMSFGFSFDSDDTYGKITEESNNIKEISEVKINEILNSFIGENIQIPSIYSAIKLNGKKLYEFARRGEEIKEIPKRKIKIYNIKLIKYDKKSLIFDVTCSKGTYIRTLVKDIGNKLGNISYMNYLIRTKSGEFIIENSISIDEISLNSIIPIENIYIENSKKIILNDVLKYNFVNGIKFDIYKINGIKKEENIIYKIYDEDNRLISISKIENNKFKNIVMLNNI